MNNYLGILISLIASLLVAIVDYYTGTEISFSIFYLIVIISFTWLYGKPFGIFLSILCTVLFIMANTYALPFVYLWNGFSRFTVYLVIVILLSEFKKSLNDSKSLIIKLEGSLEREKKLNELKSEFVSMVSHEFRTPLSIIFTSCEILEAYEKTLSFKEKHENIDTIKKEVNYLAQMLNDILMVGKMELNNITINPIPTNLISFCQNLVNNLCKTKNRKINFKYSDLNLIVNLDQRLLTIIINNLLDNAIKYSDEEIIFSISLDNNTLIFTFEDKGIGISEEDMKNLFERFHRGKNVENIPGTGLGLVIVKSSVEAHGGTIKIESNLDTGTIITVNIPVLHE